MTTEADVIEGRWYEIIDGPGTGMRGECVGRNVTSFHHVFGRLQTGQGTVTVRATAVREVQPYDRPERAKA